MKAVLVRLAGAALVAAGVVKLGAPGATCTLLYAVLGTRAAAAAAFAVAVGIDVGIGAYVVSGPRTVTSARLLSGVFLAYAAAVVAMGARVGWTSSCGCGLGDVSLAWALARNVALGAAFAVVAARTGGAARRPAPAS